MNLVVKRDRFGLMVSWNAFRDGFAIGIIEAPTLNGGRFKASLRRPDGRFGIRLEPLGEFETKADAIHAISVAT